jgi:hypothetical protein
MYTEGQYTQALNSIAHAEEKEEDSLFTKHTVYSVHTPEGKPVRLAYEGKDTDTQQHSDTHTHIQQEDTTQACDAHTDGTVDTYTLLHNDVVYDTLDIDTYIHSMIDIH